MDYLYQENKVDRYNSIEKYIHTEKPKRMAILFFGLTRNLEYTYKNFKKNILQVLKQNNITYDIFIHSYSIYGEYKNDWANEYISSYNNEHIIQIINPISCIIENQDDILSRIKIDEYYNHIGEWMKPRHPDDPEKAKLLDKKVIQNMVLALYSKKQITLTLQTYMKHTTYDYVMITRPELEFTTPLPLEKLSSLSDHNLIMPKMDFWHGANDKFMISIPSVAIYYGTLYDSLLEYSKTKQIKSEQYLFDQLQKKNIKLLTEDIKYTTHRIHTKSTKTSQVVVTNTVSE